MTTSRTNDAMWAPGKYKIFLSHKSSVKAKAANLKRKLENFGISAFVAHQDINPSKAWQTEIERALQTADALVALMTTTFHESSWTDHEVGFALARRIPVIPINLGCEPYGFLERFQALECTWDECPTQLVKILIQHSQMVDAYIAGLHDCESYNSGIVLSAALSGIAELSKKQESELISAFNSNDELKHCWGFNGRRESIYGGGVPALLRRLGRRNVVLSETNDLGYARRRSGKGVR